MVQHLEAKLGGDAYLLRWLLGSSTSLPTRGKTSGAELSVEAMGDLLNRIKLATPPTPPGGRRLRGGTLKEPLGDKIIRLWNLYEGDLKRVHANVNSCGYPLSTAELREMLRESGVEVPEPGIRGRKPKAASSLTAAPSATNLRLQASELDDYVGAVKLLSDGLNVGETVDESIVDHDVVRWLAHFCGLSIKALKICHSEEARTTLLNGVRNDLKSEIARLEKRKQIC